MCMLLMGCGVTPSGASYLLRDTFTDTNGTALDAHTMDVGDGWTVPTGSASIQSNQSRADGADTWAHADASESDVVIAVDSTLAKATGWDYCAILARLSDVNNNYQAIVYGDGSIILYERNGGTYTSRAIGTWTADTSQHTYRLVCNGSTITLSIDDVEKCSYSLATHNQTETRCGCRWSGSSLFDNFEVTA